MRSTRRQNDSLLSTRSSPPPPPPPPPPPEERELWLALATQHGEVDLDARDVSALGQRDCLRLDLLRDQDPSAGGSGRIDADALEVAGQLLDRVDRADALDLDRHPGILIVAAHQIDRADVRGPLALDEPQAFLDRHRAVGEQQLQVTLDAVLLEAGGFAHVVHHVREDFEHPDLEPVLTAPGALADDERCSVFLEHRRRRHPVQGLGPRTTQSPRAPNHESAVLFDHEEARLTRAGRRSRYVLCR